MKGQQWEVSGCLGCSQRENRHEKMKGKRAGSWEAAARSRERERAARSRERKERERERKEGERKRGKEAEREEV